MKAKIIIFLTLALMLAGAQCNDPEGSAHSDADIDTDTDTDSDSDTDIDSDSDSDTDMDSDSDTDSDADTDTDTDTEVDIDAGPPPECETLTDPCIVEDGGVLDHCWEQCGFLGQPCPETVPELVCAMVVTSTCTDGMDTSDQNNGICIPIQSLECQVDEDCCFVDLPPPNISNCPGEKYWWCDQGTCVLDCICP